MPYVDHWLKPIAGSGDRDIRAERVVTLLAQAKSMRHAAEQLDGGARLAHLREAELVAEYAQEIQDLVTRWDAQRDRPLEPAPGGWRLP